MPSFLLWLDAIDSRRYVDEKVKSALTVTITSNPTHARLTMANPMAVTVWLQVHTADATVPERIDWVE